MSNWQSGTVSANGIRIHYTRTGGDKPPLVLAHGFSDDGLCWTPLVEQLEADYDVIMVDARGHGRSDAPEQGYNDAIFGDDLAGVIAALGLEKPPVLGHSMGAMTALMLAARHPQKPGAILLEDPPARWMPSEAEQQGEDVIDEWLAERRAWIIDLKSKTREELMDEQRDETVWSEAELGPWADAKLRLSPNVMNRDYANDVDTVALMTQITCPALLITADPSLGSMATAEHADGLKAFVPQLEVVHIGGAGHNIRREQFDVYLKTVRAFLVDLPTNR